MKLMSRGRKGTLPRAKSSQPGVEAGSSSKAALFPSPSPSSTLPPAAPSPRTNRSSQMPFAMSARVASVSRADADVEETESTSTLPSTVRRPASARKPWTNARIPAPSRVSVPVGTRPGFTDSW